MMEDRIIHFLSAEVPPHQTDSGLELWTPVESEVTCPACQVWLTTPDSVEQARQRVLALLHQVIVPMGQENIEQAIDDLVQVTRNVSYHQARKAAGLVVNGAVR